MKRISPIRWPNEVQLSRHETRIEILGPGALIETEFTITNNNTSDVACSILLPTENNRPIQFSILQARGWTDYEFPQLAVASTHHLAAASEERAFSLYRYDPDRYILNGKAIAPGAGITVRQLSFMPLFKDSDDQWQLLGSLGIYSQPLDVDYRFDTGRFLEPQFAAGDESLTFVSSSPSLGRIETWRQFRRENAPIEKVNERTQLIRSGGRLGTRHTLKLPELSDRPALASTFQKETCQIVQLAVCAPPAEHSHPGRHCIVYLDTVEHESARALPRQREVVAQLVRTLDENDCFNLVVAGETLCSAFAESKPATDQNKQRALEFVHATAVVAGPPREQDIYDTFWAVKPMMDRTTDVVVLYDGKRRPRATKPLPLPSPDRLRIFTVSLGGGLPCTELSNRTFCTAGKRFELLDKDDCAPVVNQVLALSRRPVPLTMDINWPGCPERSWHTISRICNNVTSTQSFFAVYESPELHESFEVDIQYSNGMVLTLPVRPNAGPNKHALDTVLKYLAWSEAEGWLATRRHKQDQATAEANAPIHEQ